MENTSDYAHTCTYIHISMYKNEMGDLRAKEIQSLQDRKCK